MNTLSVSFSKQSLKYSPTQGCMSNYSCAACKKMKEDRPVHLRSIQSNLLYCFRVFSDCSFNRTTQHGDPTVFTCANSYLQHISGVGDGGGDDSRENTTHHISQQSLIWKRSGRQTVTVNRQHLTPRIMQSVTVYQYNVVMTVVMSSSNDKRNRHI